MTTYQKELAAMVGKYWGALSPERLVEELINIGVVDHSLCKVLAVREFVAEQMRRGGRKVDSMWLAAERFCCSYEYVRKCIYYYKDVNMPEPKS
jgi:hypothetical protein